MQGKREFITELTESNFLDSIPCAVFLKDINSQFIGCNNFLAHLAGYPDGRSMIGKTDYQMPWADESINYAEIDRAVIAGKKSIEKIEKIRLSKREIIAKTVKTPFYWNGEIVGLIGTFTDITDLVELKNQAESANRAKTEFLANLSHDVKTPLQSINLLSSGLLEDNNLSEKNRRSFELILSCQNQLSIFFKNCLDNANFELSSSEDLEECFSVKELLSELFDLSIANALEKKLSMNVETGSDIPKMVIGHRFILFRIILNLMSNALKFTENGSITLRAFVGEATDSQKINMIFQVQDTGLGIPEDKQSIIFERLSRLAPSFSKRIEGSGIGLYIVDQYVKRMGGSIQVESEVGKGSTFTVTLPFTVMKATTEHISLPEDTSKTETHSGKILLVEDVPMVQFITQSLLAETGFEVDTASSGEEALEKFLPGKYDLIFMDIGLPNMNGYDTTKAIREKEKLSHSSLTPIIALTGHGAVDVQAFCGEAGMQGVLSKPLTREQAEKVWLRYGEGKDVEIPKVLSIG